MCLYTTTSCFAPWLPDNIVEIAKLSKENGLFHLINNAYGVQCTKIADMINTACKEGEVSVIVSSTDKNFMVPVGGSIIYSPSKKGIV